MCSNLTPSSSIPLFHSRKSVQDWRARYSRVGWLMLMYRGRERQFHLNWSNHQDYSAPSKQQETHFSLLDKERKQKHDFFFAYISIWNDCELLINLIDSWASITRTYFPQNPPGKKISHQGRKQFPTRCLQRTTFRGGIHPSLELSEKKEGAERGK